VRTIREVWRALAVILLIGLVAGVLNVLLHTFVMEPWIQAQKEDEVVVSTYVLNLFVGWVFFSAWFLARADDEFKKVEEAVHRGDRETFLIEAPKVIAPSIRLLYWIISILVVLSFHLFHIASEVVTDQIQFGVGFLVVITIIFLRDLDEPIGGAVSVSGIPEEWMQALRAQQKKDMAIDMATDHAEAELADKK
jgi:hypothetical protein